ncbi:hypothetical protein [Vannielia litorea]|uniref:Uncharacterized protein n=1 Tax=Vannielia litorea TaxID=1217970 RepID=A0A1N6FUR5_9RHOB|nr:hypothetical protein [Vannielia litorea]SIN99024.1 hypothetical protein SAMN05444002_1976 [Vannielia litorea]
MSEIERKIKSMTPLDLARAITAAYANERPEVLHGILERAFRQLGYGIPKDWFAFMTNGRLRDSDVPEYREIPGWIMRFKIPGSPLGKFA